MPHHKRADLLAAAQSFCTAFAEKKLSPDEIITSYFSSSSPDQDEEEEILAHEHGLPQLAPFLGRDFRGRDGIREYFDTVAACLDYDDMRFDEYVVDAAAAKVCVRGRARFTSRATGQGWDEVFTYALAFDGAGKVKRYEIWADSGAAWLAGRGELDRVRGDGEGEGDGGGGEEGGGRGGE
ncbi:hypothetical protein F4778DRAFT_791782 [Xylariomycetidae sp. FL2044]|nr:hypothetical protein F4778DRAFT_791782 [Xylariomycetidae sp. FL2044]